MKVAWQRPGICVLQGKGEDGSEYRVEWHFKEVSLGKGLDGPKSLVGGEFAAFKDDSRIGVYESYSDAVEAVERLAMPN